MWNLVVMIVLFVVIITAAVLCVLFYFTPFCLQYNPKTSFQLVLKSDYAAQQRNLFVAFTDALNKINVPYWVTQSTLLSVSKASLFENDVIHIAVLHEYERQLVQLGSSSNQTQQRIIIQQTKGGYTSHMESIGDFPRIEIDIMVQRNHEILPCSSRDVLGECLHHDSHKRRNEIYLTSDVFPLQELVVDGVTVVVPQKLDVCAKQYGNNNRRAWLKFLFNTRTKAISKNILAAGGIL